MSTLGWCLTTLTFSALSFTAGFASGVITQTSKEDIASYKAQYVTPVSDGWPEPDLTIHTPPSPDTRKQFFPENNDIEWSLSLRPGATTIPIEIQNENESENRRILFYIVSPRQTPVLAAVLSIRAGQQAIIRPPQADYRLTVISTPENMSWKIAQKQTEISAFSLPLDNAKSSETVRLFVGSKGAIRRVEPIQNELTRRIQSGKSSQIDLNTTPGYDSLGPETEPAKDKSENDTIRKNVNLKD